MKRSENKIFNKIKPGNQSGSAFDLYCFVFSIITLLTIFALPLSSYANFLTQCKDSFAFICRTTETITKLITRLDTYEKDTPTYVIRKNELENTLNRFNTYGNQGLLCGADGLPHLIIIDLQSDHVGEFLYLSCLFLFITGYIGWIGRSYLCYTRIEMNPAINEIIIDISIAIGIVITSFFWPIAVWREMITSKLLVSTDKLTISLR